MKPRNYAFIDGNNLHLGARSQGINLDYRKFRLYLKNKFSVEKAFLFIGYDPERTRMYNYLISSGYILIHKPTVIYHENGRRMMKGNVDAEIVLHAAAIEYENYEQAVLVTSDGDFACLMDYLKKNNKLKRIITPTEFYSSLLQDFRQDILPLRNIRSIINQ